METVRRSRAWRLNTPYGFAYTRRSILSQQQVDAVVSSSSLARTAPPEKTKYTGITVYTGTSASAPTATETGAKILILPNEIQLPILSKLSAGEVQRSRQICKHFRNLIDEPKNLPLLAWPIQRRAKMQFEMYMNNLFNFDPSSTDFLDLLSRVIKHRAKTDYRVDPQILTDITEALWTYRLPHEPCPENHDHSRHALATYISCHVAGLLLTVHGKFYGPDAFSSYHFWIWASDESFIADVKRQFLVLFGENITGRFLDSLGFSESKLKKWYNAISESHTILGACADTERGSDDDDFDDFDEPLMWEDEIYNENLAAIGITKIDDRLAPLFTLRAETEWAQHAVLRVSNGESVTPIEQAAIWEDLRLY